MDPQSPSSQGEPLQTLPANDQAPEKRAKKPFPKVLALVLAALIVLAAIGAYVVGMQSKQAAVTSTIAQPTPTPYTTADWETLETKEYSLKYPSSFVVADVINAKDGTIHIVSKVGAEPEYSSYLTIREVNRGTSLEDWIKTSVIDSARASYKKQNISDGILQESRIVNGRQVTLVSGAHLPARNDSLHAYILEGNKVADFSLDGGTLDTKQRTQYNKTAEGYFFGILSTFRFTNPAQAVDTTNWKTYSDPNNRFTFQYPASSILNKELLTPDDVTLYNKSGASMQFYVRDNVASIPAKTILQEKLNAFIKRGGKINSSTISERVINSNSLTEMMLDTDTAKSIKVTHTLILPFPTGSDYIEIESGYPIDDINQILSTFKFTN